MFIEDSKFEAGRTQITKETYIAIKFSKDLNLRELINCTLIISTKINSNLNIEVPKSIQYVYQDNMIGCDQLLEIIENLIRDLIIELKSLDSGINLLEDYYINQPGLNNEDLEIKNSIIKSLENLSRYKLQPNVIELYTILTSYKGSDTLQQRKFKKMIDSIENAM